MKKLFLGMLFLGLANLAYAQNSDGASEEIKLSDVEVTPINLPYLDKVQEGVRSEWVITLEKKASRYNVKTSPYFGGPLALSKVKFAHRNGSIFATYNPEGKLLHTHERYENIALPNAIRNRVSSEFPEWSMSKNIYSVNYNHKKGAKKLYKIQVEKDGIKKSLKLDSE